MTEKELSYKTNKELSVLLTEIIEGSKIGLEKIRKDYPKETVQQMEYEIRLLGEIRKRLETKQRYSFNDEAFSMKKNNEIP